jgi:hypothetical protein
VHWSEALKIGHDVLRRETQQALVRKFTLGESTCHLKINRLY